MANTSYQTVIVDYGMGNLFNIQRSFQYVGESSLITDNPKIIENAQRLILPGVGAFGDGIKNLKKRNLISPIKNFLASGKFLLGICLGMQLLMTTSEEFGYHHGLDLIAGSVKRLSAQASYKIPHFGWNTLQHPKNTSNSPDKGSWKNTILEKITEKDFVYFVHSYAVIPKDPSCILAETLYGNNRFCSVVQQNNIIGCQFHPEISDEIIGLKILKNFCTISRAAPLKLI